MVRKKPSMVGMNKLIINTRCVDVSFILDRSSWQPRYKFYHM